MADRVHAGDVEAGDRLGQEGLRHGSEVVEADRALDRHPVFWSELYVGIDPSYRPSHQRNDYVAQPRERLVTCEDDNRAAALRLEFEP